MLSHHSDVSCGANITLVSIACSSEPSIHAAHLVMLMNNLRCTVPKIKKEYLSPPQPHTWETILVFHYYWIDVPIGHAVNLTLLLFFFSCFVFLFFVFVFPSVLEFSPGYYVCEASTLPLKETSRSHYQLTLTNFIVLEQSGFPDLKFFQSESQGTSAGFLLVLLLDIQ